MAWYPIIVLQGTNTLHGNAAATKWLTIVLVIIGGTILLGIIIALVLGSLRKDKDKSEAPVGNSLLEAAVKRRREEAREVQSPTEGQSHKQEESE